MGVGSLLFLDGITLLLIASPLSDILIGTV